MHRHNGMNVWEMSEPLSWWPSRLPVDDRRPPSHFARSCLGVSVRVLRERTGVGNRAGGAKRSKCWRQ